MAQIKKVKKIRSTTLQESESPDIPVTGPEEVLEDRVDVETEDVDEGDQDQADEEDDAPEGAVQPSQPFAEAPWLLDPKCPKDAIVIGPGEPIRVTGVFVNDKQIRTDKRVLRANSIPRAKGWYFTLVYGKGALVPANRVKTVNGEEIHAVNPIKTLRLDQAKFPMATTSDGFSLPRSA